MLDLLRSWFGTYAPITAADGSIPSGLAGVNFEYVAQVVIFMICLVCVFKLIGVVLRHI